MLFPSMQILFISKNIFAHGDFRGKTFIFQNNNVRIWFYIEINNFLTKHFLFLLEKQEC